MLCICCAQGWLPGLDGSWFVLDSRLHGHPHLRGRPATLKSASAWAGEIVRRHFQNVIARLAKGRGGRRLACEIRRRRRLEFGLFDLRGGVAKRHLTGTAKL